MCYTQEDMCRRDAEAKAVLLSVLTPAQAHQYHCDGYFDVDVNGRVYRIFGNGGSYNVTLMSNDGPLWRYCAGPVDSMPVYYFVLSQLLMLTTDEARFLRIANKARP